MTVKYYKLRSMPSAKCRVAICYNDNDTIYSIGLVSYNTLVLKVYDGKIKRTWMGMSATTSRHINRFTKEFTGNNLYQKWRDMPFDTYEPLSDEEYSNLFGVAYSYRNNDKPVYIATDFFHMLK